MHEYNNSDVRALLYSTIQYNTIQYSLLDVDLSNNLHFPPNDCATSMNTTTNFDILLLHYQEILMLPPSSCYIHLIKPLHIVQAPVCHLHLVTNQPTNQPSLADLHL